MIDYYERPEMMNDLGIGIWILLLRLFIPVYIATLDLLPSPFGRTLCLTTLRGCSCVGITCADRIRPGVDAPPAHSWTHICDSPTPPTPGVDSSHPVVPCPLANDRARLHYAVLFPDSPDLFHIT